MRIETLERKTALLEESIKIKVFLPDFYDETEKRYPVLYMNDGQDVFRDQDTFRGAESLRFEKYYQDYKKFLPEVILVAVYAPGEQDVRTALYSPFTKAFDVPKGKIFEPYIEGRGALYLDWMTQELKPEIDTLYRTLPEADATGICGYSTGGLNSAYGILKYGHIFHRAIIMSAAVAIWMDKLKDVLVHSDYAHIKRLYLDTGTNEFGRMSTKEEFLEGSETLRAFFQSSCVSEEIVKYNVYQGAVHDQREWRMRFPDALRWVFPEY